MPAEKPTILSKLTVSLSLTNVSNCAWRAVTFPSYEPVRVPALAIRVVDEPFMVPVPHTS